MSSREIAAKRSLTGTLAPFHRSAKKAVRKRYLNIYEKHLKMMPARSVQREECCCHRCLGPVNPHSRVDYRNKTWHRKCFRCQRCGSAFCAAYYREYPAPACVRPIWEVKLRAIAAAREETAENEDEVNLIREVDQALQASEAARWLDRAKIPCGSSSSLSSPVTNVVETPRKCTTAPKSGTYNAVDEPLKEEVSDDEPSAEVISNGENPMEEIAEGKLSLEAKSEYKPSRVNVLDKETSAQEIAYGEVSVREFSGDKTLVEETSLKETSAEETFAYELRVEETSEPNLVKKTRSVQKVDRAPPASEVKTCRDDMVESLCTSTPGPTTRLQAAGSCFAECSPLKRPLLDTPRKKERVQKKLCVK